VESEAGKEEEKGRKEGAEANNEQTEMCPLR
jgi:hypothetical protein